MNAGTGPLAPVSVMVLASVDEGHAGPNAGAAIAGFLLMALWVAVFVLQVRRQRNRRGGGQPGSDGDDGPAASSSRAHATGGSAGEEQPEPEPQDPT